MAQNIPPRERSKRKSQKKAYNDYVCDNSEAKPQNKKLPCKGCELVFNNKRTLLLHQAQCVTVKINLAENGSFFSQKTSKPLQQNVATLDEEKILPPSQPLNNNDDDKDPPKSYAAAVCPLVAVNTGQVPTQTNPNSQETRFDEDTVEKQQGMMKTALL